MLREAFWRGIDDVMGKWGALWLPIGSGTAPALRPIVFENASGVFTLPAPKPPNAVGWPNDAPRK